MRLRYPAVISLTAALALGPVLTTPALAGGHGSPTSVAAAAKKPTAKPTKPQPVKTQPAKPTKPPKPVPTKAPKPQPTKTVKAVSFGLSGTLTGVDAAASTVTLLAKGGKDTRGTTVTVLVATTARIRLNDAVSTLAALPLGARVAVSGTALGSVRTAVKVSVEVHIVPTPTPTPTPTESVEPVEPVETTEPVEPVETTEPVEPVETVEPVQSSEAVETPAA
ncbi:MAG TPA: hypothetical protein VF657_21810 [Actinoplanes sp.]|jgi:hypothetical protein